MTRRSTLLAAVAAGVPGLSGSAAPGAQPAAPGGRQRQAMAELDKVYEALVKVAGAGR